MSAHKSGSMLQYRRTHVCRFPQAEKRNHSIVKNHRKIGRKHFTPPAPMRSGCTRTQPVYQLAPIKSMRLYLPGNVHGAAYLTLLKGFHSRGRTGCSHQTTKDGLMSKLGSIILLVKRSYCINSLHYCSKRCDDTSE